MELSVAQSEALAADAVYREPIGADEILLVGDLTFGVPVLREFYDDPDGDGFSCVEAAIRGERPETQKFLKWCSGDVLSAMSRLREVQKIRDLMKEAERKCCSGGCSKTL